MDEMTTRMPDETDDLEDTTVGTLCESIETNMWLADAYFARGAQGLATECLRAAWLEYVRFRDILRVYAGDELGQRIIRALTTTAGDCAGTLALGPADGAVTRA